MYGKAGTVLKLDMWNLMVQQFGQMTVRKNENWKSLGSEGFRVSGYVIRVYYYYLR